MKLALSIAINFLALLLLQKTGLSQVDCYTTSQEQASTVLRTVRLENYGLEVDIPSNYRAMQREDGSVEILHPGDYEMLQCIAQGGYGFGGYYSESISQMQRDRSMTLKEQALTLSSSWGIEQVIDYQDENLSGYILISSSGYSVSFLGQIIGREDIVGISVGCDCDVSVDDLKSIISRIRPI